MIYATGKIRPAWFSCGTADGLASEPVRQVSSRRNPNSWAQFTGKYSLKSGYKGLGFFGRSPHLLGGDSDLPAGCAAVDGTLKLLVMAFLAADLLGKWRPVDPRADSAMLFYRTYGARPIDIEGGWSAGGYSITELRRHHPQYHGYHDWCRERTARLARPVINPV